MKFERATLWMIAGLTLVGAGRAGGASSVLPSTPDKPGRATDAEPNYPVIPQPTSQPSATHEPIPPEGTPAESDEDFLKQASNDLGVPDRTHQLDVRVLNWFGLRPRVEETGLTVVGNFTADYQKNLMGGLSTASDAFHSLLDLRLNYDPRPLLGISGGLFSFDFQNQNGKNGSDRLVGDVQGFDNTDADGRTQISELWYQQQLLDNRLRLKVGKVDANTEFAAPAGGAGFLNSSFGYSPTLFLLPTYPDPAMSVNAFYYPTTWLSFSAGVYDGSGERGLLTGSYGPKYFFNGPGDYFFIGETNFRWAFRNQTLPGRVALGGWYSTGSIPALDGVTSADGTGGGYAIVEQQIWHKQYYNPGDAVGLTAFAQYGFADPNLSPVSQHIGAGLAWTGIIPTEQRSNDTLGMGATYAALSHNPAAGFTEPYELSIEAFYGIQLTPYFVVKPDLQYIEHDGGVGGHDAMVFTLRGTLAF